MNNKKPSLTELNAFVCVASHLNFRKAADDLGVSRSALSHLIKGLEQTLGVQLFRRTTRSVSVTESGEKLMREIHPLLKSMDNILFTISETGSKPQGSLRINGSEGALRHLLNHYLYDFHAQFPNVDIDLYSDGTFSDITELEFDAGIRLGESVPKDMIAVRISKNVRFLAVASPDYLSNKKKPLHPKDLLMHQCIRQRLPSGKRYLWEFGSEDNELKIDPPGSLTLNNNHLMTEACLKGLGIAYIPEGYATKSIEEGKLVVLLEEWCPSEPGLFLYFPRYLHMNSTLRALIDFIRAKGISA